MKDGEKVGVIEYSTIQEAENAVRTLDGETLHGNSVRIRMVIYPSGPTQ